MSENEALNELRALDAIAAEQDAVLAFRVCDDSGDFEPVLLRIFTANAAEENETTLLAIDDEHGFSLGRYVISRSRLDDALERAEDVDADAAEDEAVVPIEWERG